MWLQDFLVARAQSNRFLRQQNRSIRKHRRHLARKFEQLETRHLLAAAPITFAAAAISVYAIAGRITPESIQVAQQPG